MTPGNFQLMTPKNRALAEIERRERNRLAFKKLMEQHHEAMAYYKNVKAGALRRHKNVRKTLLRAARLRRKQNKRKPRILFTVKFKP
jgi:hypothetical protein